MKPSSVPQLLQLLKKPTYLIVMVGFAVLLFDLQFLMMSRLPGYENEMCVMGAGLNASNISFAVIISLLGGLLMVGFFETLKARQLSIGALSVSGIGAILGSMTVFCAACTLPVFSLFGMAFGLTFLTDYNLWFKVISLALMLVGLWQIEKQLRGTCKICVE